MTVPTTVEFCARFPEFSSQLSAVVDSALAEANRFVSETVWENVHTEAVSYLAAHILAIRTVQIGNQIGAPAGTAVGQRIDSTLYGQEYKRLLDSRPICGFAF